MTSVLHFTTNKASFTLQRILGTVRIKVVRVPKRIVLISHLHVLSSTVLNDVKLCLGTGKRLNVSASVLNSCLVRMLLTCFPKSVLTKGEKAHQRKDGSARLIVYTTHLIRAGLVFQDCVPILSVLGLSLDMVRARVKVWSSTDGAKRLTRQILSVPNHREHTLLLNRKRVNKGMKRTNSLLLLFLRDLTAEKTATYKYCVAL